MNRPVMTNCFQLGQHAQLHDSVIERSLLRRRLASGADILGQALERLNRPFGTLTLVVLVAGCTPPAPRQYRAPLSSLASEKCRALERVIEAREQFGINARSRDADEAALERCRLEPPSTGAESRSQISAHPPYVAPPSATSSVVVETESKDEVRLQPYNGVFAVPVVINGAVSIPFVLDSGAADVQLPADVVLTLVRSGTLSESDFIGESSYILANGSALRSARFTIRELRVGDHVVRNVAASVGSVSSDALLGQSFLSRVGSWTLDNGRHVLVLAR
jgi:clan AA aspartic protease (TIGR02281 family)